MRVAVCQENRQNLLCSSDADNDAPGSFRICGGDSGGPLIDYDRVSRKPFIVGIVVRPGIMAQHAGCYTDAIFAKLFPAYTSWMSDVMQAHPVTVATTTPPSCATLSPVDHRAEVAAAPVHRAAERGGGPFEMGLAPGKRTCPWHQPTCATPITPSSIRTSPRSRGKAGAATTPCRMSGAPPSRTGESRGLSPCSTSIWGGPGPRASPRRRPPSRGAPIRPVPGVRYAISPTSFG